MLPLHVFEIFLVICLYSQHFGTSALQCYYCKNCKESDELQEMHICGELALESFESTSRTTTFIATSTSAIINEDTTSTTTVQTTTEGIPISSITTDETRVTNQATTIIESMDASTSEATTSTITTTTTTSETILNESTTEAQDPETVQVEEEITSTTQKTPGTSTVAAVAGGNDSDQDYLDYDSNDYSEGRQNDISRKHFQARQVIASPICYKLTAIVNGTVVINRGCANMVNDNNEETCSAIYDYTDGRVLDCQLCNTNACNKFFIENAATGAASAALLSEKIYFSQTLSSTILFVILINLFTY